MKKGLSSAPTASSRTEYRLFYSLASNNPSKNAEWLRLTEHARNILVNLSSDQIRQLRLYSLLEIEEASQDIKTADATPGSLQQQKVAIAQDEPRPSTMETIVNALVAIVALFLALFGFGISDAPTEEVAKSVEAVKKVSLERKKAERRIKRAEAHMRAIDRLVEAQQLDIGDNGTGSWEIVQSDAFSPVCCKWCPPPIVISVSPLTTSASRRVIGAGAHCLGQVQEIEARADKGLIPVTHRLLIQPTPVINRNGFLSLSPTPLFQQLSLIPTTAITFAAMVPRTSVPELRPRAPYPLHPQAEPHGEQLSNDEPGLNGFDGTDTPHNCLIAGCDHIFAVIICEPNDESPWNFFVTELYRIQGPSKLPYKISPAFLQINYRSEYLDLLRLEIRLAVENYNTMVLDWWARLAAWMGGRVFELRDVNAAVAQLKSQLLDAEMVAGRMNERLSPLGQGRFVRFR
ncbi:hypothetical protein FPCIR_12909 [Fusarium pseudocircinatum]|uniref:Uncharacterized protein n=1 Tax=Fusarium pseudocircinatum TaxID=56676 RepID=A0A8H5NU25_9HYPO|nr:hypothetical protein FPCIR_12909 [Fusarium pseudocircinatum]